MSVNVAGYFKNNVGILDIYNFILQVYDIGATVSESRVTFEHDDNLPKEEIRLIKFKHKNENRELKVIYNTRIKDASECKFEFTSNLCTYITLKRFGYAEEIVTELLGHFGGYIDKNDCDDDGFEPVDSNINALVKPIKNMTLKEVYRDYGSLVIINKE